jgi:hypothetical protein
MKARAKLAYIVAKVPGSGWLVAALVLLVVGALCVRCTGSVADIAQGIAGPEGTLPDSPGAAPVAPGPAPSQVVADTLGNAFTAPWLVTVGLGQRDTFRLRLEGSGDQELVLFQTDTLVARFVPNWQVESRRGSLAASDFTGLLAAAVVLHVEIEHFGNGAFHEWSVPIDGKALGKTQVFFLWQRADGSNRSHGSFDVEVVP